MLEVRIVVSFREEDKDIDWVKVGYRLLSILYCFSSISCFSIVFLHLGRGFMAMFTSS